MCARFASSELDPVASPAVEDEEARALAAEAAIAGDLSDETARATVAEALKAPLASPALTGNPTTPTQSPGNNSTRAASTAYADAAVAVELARAAAAEALRPAWGALNPGTGKYIQCLRGGVVGGILATTATLCAAPIFLAESVTISAIAAYVSSVNQDGTPILRLGLWLPDGVANGPGTLVAEATVSAVGAGAKEATMSRTLAAGKHWISVVGQGYSTTAPSIGGWLGWHPGCISHDSVDALQTTTGGVHHSGTVTGTLPSAWVPFGARVQTPALALKVA